jgi:hypothetical protein
MSSRHRQELSLTDPGLLPGEAGPNHRMEDAQPPPGARDDGRFMGHPVPELLVMQLHRRIVGGTVPAIRVISVAQPASSLGTRNVVCSGRGGADMGCPFLDASGRLVRYRFLVLVMRAHECSWLR